MTREEFLGAYNIGNRDGKEGDYLPNDYDDIFHIEESNTDVFDKIRTEIDQEYTKFRNKSDMWNERACGLGTALEIIDKYKAESEEANGR